jgi:cell division protein FtsI (penicillin-binding protein 3)
VLTIDINTQAIVEEELRRGVESAGAISGTAVAIDPRTGEILAIASWPSFDPNNLKSADPAAVRVRAITDTYEPGSTMKAITAAAALEEDAVELDEMIDGEQGKYQMAGHVITDDHGGGMMTFRAALEQSSNIVFAKVASRLPAPRFYKYVRDFGFGIISGIDLPGEAQGEVKKPNQFTAGTQQFMAFGYQLSVTPLQLACAYAALANDGIMMKPHLLKRRLNREGETVEEIEPQQIRRVVSSKTAARIRDMMVGVVERGTGREARLPGLLIAGKTGTSQQLLEGTYSKSNYNASFVGFFPADDPKVTLLVLLDSPRNGYYGGQVAAPIFREIARRVVNASMEGSEPQTYQAAAGVDSAGGVVVPAGGRIHLPDLRGIDQESARQIAEKSGFRVTFRGEGTFVAAQEPAAGTIAAVRSVITLFAAKPGTSMKMPDLRGLSLRRAMNILNAHRIRPRITGSGEVRSQSPPPGAPLQERSRTATLECR